jgi:hypothetical protein
LRQAANLAFLKSSAHDVMKPAFHSHDACASKGQGWALGLLLIPQPAALRVG